MSVERGGRSLTSVEIEQVILGTLQDLLVRRDFGVHDNFFDLGADSQLIVTARDRLMVALGRDLPMVDLFTYPNVAALAAYLSGQQDGAAAEEAQRRAEQRLARLASRRDRQTRSSGTGEV